MSSKILNKLMRGVRDLDEELTTEAAKEALANNIVPEEAINEGLIKGMHEVGKLYEREEYFIPELLLSSDVLSAGLSIISPYLEQKDSFDSTKAVIGVVEGDNHDIGKNLVKLMLEVSGFQVFDLGRDVNLNHFVDKVKEVKAELLCLSALMSTNMGSMDKVISLLVEEGIREDVTVLVGGGAVTQRFADDIGADGYAGNANEAINIAKKLLATRGVMVKK